MSPDRVHDSLNHQSLLRLLHLADSAIPIGTLSHSFGLESLIDEQFHIDALPALLITLLQESFLMDAVFCRKAHQFATNRLSIEKLNELLSARKPAREAREASLTLGRRFNKLVSALEATPPAATGQNDHFAIAFGVACSKLGVPEDPCVLAYLEQSCASALSSLVRLIALGPVSANVILWNLKSAIVETCERSRELEPSRVFCFIPALEIASMRHPCQETRLFVS